MLDQSQVIGFFVLAYKFQEAFWSMFEWPYLQRYVINRMNQKLVWLSFSKDPICVPNYKEIGRGHVLIWHRMTHN